jgi:hypothetical protein
MGLQFYAAVRSYTMITAKSAFSIFAVPGTSRKPTAHATMYSGCTIEWIKPADQTEEENHDIRRSKRLKNFREYTSD